MASSAASFLSAFSKPPMPPTNAVFSYRSTNLSNTSGVGDFSTRLGLDPATAVDVSKQKFPLSHADDTRIDYICSKPSLVQYNLDPATSQVILRACPDSGAPPMNNTGTNYALYMSTTAFTSAMFRYWNGTIIYDLEFVANSFLRANYIVNIIPPGIPIPSLPDQQGGFLTHYISVSGRTKYRLEVPYLYPTPYYTTNGNLNGDTESEDLTITRVVITLLHSVQSPYTTPPPIHLNVRVSSKDNHFAIPELTWIQKYSSYINLQPQALEDINLEMFGEDTVDLLNLTRRSSLLYTIKQTSTSDFTKMIALPIHPLLPALNPVCFIGGTIEFGQVNWTFQSFLSTAYLCCNGSTRIKVYSYNTEINQFTIAANNVNIPPGQYTITTPYPTIGSYTESFVPTSNGIALCYLSSIAPLAEVEFPNQYPYAFQTAYDHTYPITGGLNFNMNCYTLTVIDNEIDYHPYIFGSAGDDYTIGGFLSTPAVTAILPPG